MFVSIDVDVLMTVSFLFKIKKRNKSLCFISLKCIFSRPPTAVVSIYSVRFFIYIYMILICYKLLFLLSFFFQNYTRVHSDCQNERSVRNFQSYFQNRNLKNYSILSICLFFYREDK